MFKGKKLPLTHRITQAKRIIQRQVPIPIETSRRLTVSAKNSHPIQQLRHPSQLPLTSCPPAPQQRSVWGRHPGPSPRSLSFPPWSCPCTSSSPKVRDLHLPGNPNTNPVTMQIRIGAHDRKDKNAHRGTRVGHRPAQRNATQRTDKTESGFLNTHLLHVLIANLTLPRLLQFVEPAALPLLGTVLRREPRMLHGGIVGFGELLFGLG